MEDEVEVAFSDSIADLILEGCWILGARCGLQLPILKYPSVLRGDLCEKKKGAVFVPAFD